MRGFLSGVIWGGVLTGAGLVALSLMSPVAPRPELASDVGAASMNAPSTGQPAGTRQASRDPDLVETAPAAPDPGDADRDTLAPLDNSATAPGNRPRVAESPQEPVTLAPGTGTEPQVSALEAAPEAPSPRAQPASPAEGANPPSVSTPVAPPRATADGGTLDPAPQGDPSLPARPQADDSAPGGTAPAAPVIAPQAEPAPEVATRPAAAPQPARRPADVAAHDPASADPAKPRAMDTATPGDAAPATMPEQSGERVPQADVTAGTEPAGAPPAPRIAVQPEAPRAPPVVRPPPGSENGETDSAAAPRIAALPQTGEEDGQELRPTIGARVLPLTERDAATPGAQGDTPPDTPLQRYAQAHDNPEKMPMMAIVLIDDSRSVGVEALRDFPYPVTFAVDPAAPDAVEKMARHRAAGFEVLALVDLPQNSTAQDAEIALSAGFARLDQAIGVLEGTGTGLQGNRALSEQVIAFVGATGRGLITQGSGLNTVPKLAVRDGIPAAPVFRDFDGAGQTPTVMRRFLDQAAFRARQEGAVVMLGRVRPETISALLIWGLQDRSDALSLAPASAVLKASVAE